MEEDLKGMQVVIAGRTYPLRVKSGDEDSIQQVVDSLNEKVRDFQLTYINKDVQDCLAMALLTYAVELQKQTQKEETSDDLVKKVDQLETLIDDILK